MKFSVHHPLRQIPGVGVSVEQDLLDLGFSRIEELKGKDPEKMYADLCALHGAHIDRCMLYTFRCAVYFASNTKHDPAKLKWWNWQGSKVAL